MMVNASIGHHDQLVVLMSLCADFPCPGVASQEAVVSVARTTELFVAMLAMEAHKVAVENNRKTIKFEDIIVVSQRNTKQLEFMNEAFESSGMKIEP